jgi:putrescine aminotransferase
MCIRPDGTSDVYAVIVEPFNSGLLRSCSVEFLGWLREICDSMNIILIFDEVFSGWGKTGELFYFMKHGVVPDILAISKTLGGGKASISAYTARTSVYRRAYDNKRDFMLHITTYNGFSEECVTALETIRVLIRDNLVGRACMIGHQLEAGLNRLKLKYPNLILEVRNSGAHYGMIFYPPPLRYLENMARHLPGNLFCDSKLIHKVLICSIISALYDHEDILTWFVPNSDLPFMLSPSLITTEDEINRVMESLDRSLAKGGLKLMTGFMVSAIRSMKLNPFAYYKQAAIRDFVP